MLGHVFLDQHPVPAGEVLPLQHTQLVDRRLLPQWNANNATQHLHVADAQGMVADGTHQRRLHAADVGNCGCHSGNITAHEGDVGETELGVGLGVRGPQIEVRVVGGNEHDHAEEHGDGHRDELGPVTANVTPQLPVERTHHVSASASTGDSMRTSSTIVPDRRRRTRSAIAPMAALCVTRTIV